MVKAGLPETQFQRCNVPPAATALMGGAIGPGTPVSWGFRTPGGWAMWNDPIEGSVTVMSPLSLYPRGFFNTRHANSLDGLDEREEWANRLPPLRIQPQLS